MALQKQLYSVDFTAGANTKLKDKFVLPGKPTLLKNAAFDDGGVVTKRSGYDRLSDGTLALGGTIPAADLLALFGDELLQGARESLYSYGPGKSWLIARGRNSFVSLRKQQLTRNTASQSNADSNSDGTFAFHAWEDSRGGIRYSIQDEATGAFYQSDKSISATGQMPRVLVTAAYFAVVFIEGVNVKVARVPRTAPSSALVISAALVGDVSATKTMDAIVVDSANNIIAVTYRNAANIVTFRYTVAGAVGTLVTDAEAGAVTAQALAMTTDGRVQTVWASATGIKARAYTAALVGVGGPTVVDAAGAGASQLTACEDVTVNQVVAFYLTTSVAPNAVIRSCQFSSAAPPSETASSSCTVRSPPLPSSTTGKSTSRSCSTRRRRPASSFWTPPGPSLRAGSCSRARRAPRRRSGSARLSRSAGRRWRSRCSSAAASPSRAA
jgi:hypothetical protein